MSQGFVYGVAVAITFFMQVSGFAVAWALRTETFYDILGGLNYIALAVWSAAAGSSFAALAWKDDPWKIAATILFIFSRGWLLLFLAWRAHERKGDQRFDDVLGRGRHPANPVMFFVFWIAQGFWVMLISMPMIFINSSSVSRHDVGDAVWLAGFGLGGLIEIVADVQKAWWVNQGRPGTFCSVGLWGYSRHPNYFGEILQWWCFWAFACSCSEKSGGGLLDPLWWLCVVSPLFTMHILFNMEPTGISNAEGQNLKRYYDACPAQYASYRENTSILIPMIGYGFMPMALKRTVFLDFERFEYKPVRA